MSIFPASSTCLFPLQLQELLEYMRKLEARLEKVADEKWNEDAATEDEEATAGLSLYTPNLATPLPHSASPVEKESASFFPRPWPLFSSAVPLIQRRSS